MRDQLRREIEAAVGVLLGEAGDRGALPRFALEPPRLPQHGDFACNAALLLSRRLRRSPREIADRLLAALGDAGGLLARSEAAGPGFLNLWVSDARWREVLVDILRLGPRYGRSSQGKGERVQVEFVSANPTGPLTLGHGRQAVLGDSIARLLESQGYEVTREYYFNDGGRQMRLLGESVRARYLEQLGLAAPPPDECLRHSHAPWATTVDGLPVAFPQGGYQGEYIHEIAAALRAKHGDALAHETSDGPFRRYAQERIFEDIRSMLASLGIEFDVYTNETTLYETGKVQQTLDDLRAKDLVYEADGATWLRATALGLERDRVLIKQSGEPTYLLPDVAYHRDKFRRDFSRVIDVQGADHIEQFPFVRSAVAALSCPAERVELVMHQFVTLTRGGQQVKQSTRRATYVTVGELLDDVGVDVF